jgi:hypothetical protein
LEAGDDVLAQLIGLQRHSLRRPGEDDQRSGEEYSQNTAHGKSLSISIPGLGSHDTSKRLILE